MGGTFKKERTCILFQIPLKKTSADHLYHVFPWDLEALVSADSNTNHLAIQVMLVEINHSLISLAIQLHFTIHLEYVGLLLVFTHMIAKITPKPVWSMSLYIHKIKQIMKASMFWEGLFCKNSRLKPAYTLKYNRRESTKI